MEMMIMTATMGVETGCVFVATTGDTLSCSAEVDAEVDAEVEVAESDSESVTDAVG